jgi:hypothetical protein
MARRLVTDVHAWLASDDTGWPFAFVAICHALGLDPGYLRGGLQRLSVCAARGNGRKPPLRRIVGAMRHRVVSRRLGRVA